MFVHSPVYGAGESTEREKWLLAPNSVMLGKRAVRAPESL